MSSAGLARQDGASFDPEQPIPSPVTLVPPAPAADVAARYGARLAFETDCADVAAAQSAGVPDFVLLDVRAPALFRERHVPGAVNLPRGKVTARRMTEWPPGTLFVVYCAGPHCNGADRAAAHLAGLGLPVKVMTGGVTGWADEGLAYAVEAAPVPRGHRPPT